MAGRAGASVAKNIGYFPNANAPCVPERRASQAPYATDAMETDGGDNSCRVYGWEYEIYLLFLCIILRRMGALVGSLG